MKHKLVQKIKAKQQKIRDVYERIDEGLRKSKAHNKE